MGAVALALAGVGLRLAFVAAFPAEPVSDFRGLVVFGLRLRDEGLAVPGWHWVQFNPGLPLLLSALFRVFPRGVAETARVATAVTTGLVPLLPYWLWRPILAWRWRLVAGLALALWPGQVFFSGAVAQENWVLVPAVALAALAVRCLRDPRGPGHPVAAGLLLFAAAAIRQEMLVVLALPALGAAGLLGRGRDRVARAVRFGAAATIPLLCLALQRQAATGRFAITSDHGGIGLLGSAVPGSAAAGWLDPTLYVAAREPALLGDPAGFRREATRLAKDELARRYRFHAFRAAVTALRLSVESDAQNLFWCLETPAALPPGRAAAGAAWARTWRPALRVELALLTGLFAAALVRAIRKRDAALLVLCGAVVVKVAVHLLWSPLGRLMVPAIALEILAVCLAAADVAPPAPRSERTGFLLLAGVFTAVLLVAEPPLVRLAIRKDEAPPVVTRFPLGIAGGGGWAACTVESGRLSAISGDRAWIEAADGGGAGEPAGRVSCLLPELSSDAPLVLDLECPARSGTGPGRAFERVEADGAERFRRDLVAESGSPWRRVPLSDASGSPPRVVAVESGGGPVGFGFLRRAPGAAPLPRERVLP